MLYWHDQKPTWVRLIFSMEQQLLRVCCYGPGRQEISIDCCTTGAQQQIARPMSSVTGVVSWIPNGSRWARPEFVGYPGLRPGFSDKVHIGSARVSGKSTGPVRVVEFDTDEEAEHRLICHAEFRPQERDFNAQFTLPDRTIRAISSSVALGRCEFSRRWSAIVCGYPISNLNTKK